MREGHRTLQAFHVMDKITAHLFFREIDIECRNVIGLHADPFAVKKMADGLGENAAKITFTGIIFVLTLLVICFAAYVQPAN